MNYKKEVIFLLFLCAVFFTPCLPFWGLSKTPEQEQAISVTEQLQILEKKLTKSIDKKINFEHEKLQKTCGQLAQDVAAQHFFETVKQMHQAIRVDPLYIKKQLIQSSLELIQELKRYNCSLVQPQLLKRVDDLYNSTFIQTEEPLLTFLRKERIHLLELNDEAIVIKTLYRQINSVEKQLIQELEIAQKQLLSHEVVFELKSAYTQYTELPLTQQLKIILNSLWDLYLEREGICLKNKEYRTLLRIQNKEFKPQFFLCTQELANLETIKKEYFLETSFNEIINFLSI